MNWNAAIGCWPSRRELAVALLLVAPSSVVAQHPLPRSFVEMSSPAASGAREPSLSTMSDGRILMSWTEPSGTAFAVKIAIADAYGWSEPRTVVQSDDLFVNWADFPSAIALSDGTLAAHWLQLNGDASYQYDVNIALSHDEGKTWTAPLIPHDDRSQREHGFATLLPTANGEFTAVWLDARSYDTYGSQGVAENAMQLRARSIAVDNTMGKDTLLDVRTCTCCQTSAVVTDKGNALVVYRDRSLGEIRDISIVRELDEGWSEPTLVGVDDWHIEGCPVNGPAVDAAGGQVAVAWFTAADDVPKVQVAFSTDDGASFGGALQIDNGAPSGRVDVIQFPSGVALVTWVEQTSQGEAILMCEVRPDNGCSHTEIISVSPAGRTVGFPRMAMGEAGVLVAWTESARQTAKMPKAGLTIRTVLARIGDVK